MLEIIKSSTEISDIFAHGKRYHSPFVTLIVQKRQGQHDCNGRVAFLAGKRLGNAVWRNQAKRRMRAICQSLSGPWDGYNVIFLAKRSTTRVPYSKVLHASEGLIRQIMPDSK
ncbi:MAG: ribonuclease P protein component [Eggerthellaceae bacterium]|nr:ribonuclease P protein component [Eggerthellaceae bacterium]